MPPLTPSPLTAQCSTVRLRLQQHPSTPSSASDLTRDPTPEIVDRLLQCKAWDVGARMVGQMNHKGEWGCVLELDGRRIPCSDGRWIAEAKTLALQLEATPVAPLTAGLSLRAPTTSKALSHMWYDRVLLTAGWQTVNLDRGSNDPKHPSDRWWTRQGTRPVKMRREAYAETPKDSRPPKPEWMVQLEQQPQQPPQQQQQQQHTSSSHGWLECSICLEDLRGASAEERLALPCAHVFHAACIESWLRTQSNCPECQTPAQ
jgi:hypothetical protein